MINEALFSSDKMDWETPQDFFNALNEEFHFNIDVAASADNAKCHLYYDEARDGLSQEWDGVCWCNPPYGRDIGLWVAKAHNEAQRGVTTVMLIPARTDTRYFHDYIYGKYKIRFIKGRLRFGNSKNSAPFPSMVVIFESK